MSKTTTIKWWPWSAEDEKEKAYVKQNNTGNLSGRMKRVGKLARPTAKEPAYPCYTRPDEK